MESKIVIGITLILIGVGFIVSLAQPSSGNDRTINLAWRDGWMAYSTDSCAVNSFHFKADNLENDDNAAALENAWAESIAEAQKLENDWNKLTPEQKLAYPIQPFWKSGKGLPRRISKSQKHKIIDALSPYKGS